MSHTERADPVLPPPMTSSVLSISAWGDSSTNRSQCSRERDTRCTVFQQQIESTERLRRSDTEWAFRVLPSQKHPCGHRIRGLWESGVDRRSRRAEQTPVSGLGPDGLHATLAARDETTKHRFRVGRQTSRETAVEDRGTPPLHLFFRETEQSHDHPHPVTSSVLWVTAPSSSWRTIESSGGRRFHRSCRRGFP